jgi:hypothetical protein
MPQTFTPAQFRLIEATIDDQLEENTRVPIVWLHKLWYLDSIVYDRLYLASAETPHAKNTQGEWEPIGRGVVKPDDDELDLMLHVCRRSEKLHFDVRYAELTDGTMKILRSGESFPNTTGRFFTYEEGDYVLQDAPLQSTPLIEGDI